ncbi:MFS transporter [Photobacterium damselae]|uniref:MFS transporter n=1 Tax=Photobacterium damselae TaxID=38293 RepID=UPI001D14D057|nr:MFS transporter [Photobacterium damselae]
MVVLWGNYEGIPQGFVGCTVGLLLAVVSVKVHSDYQIYVLFLGFMLFNFMNNLGPNAQTYLISGEVFPVKIRAKGAGFAASIAKLGAILTAFMFPILGSDPN